MPLDQAIYSASNNKIYGVRGQYIYQFNASTAALENTLRFIDAGLFCEASVVKVGTFLYASIWRSILDPNPSPFGISDMYKIDLGLTTSTALGIALSITGSGLGFGNLITDGTYIMGATGYQQKITPKGRFAVDPTNIATYSEWNSEAGNSAPLIDLEWDDTNKTIWEAESAGPECDAYYVPAGTKLTDSSVANPTPPSIFGLTRYPTGTKIYCVGRNRNIIKVNGNEAVATLPAFFSNATWSTLTNILSVGATPVKIKYNSNDGLIYVPTWTGDKVEVLNPTTDTITAIKSGFSSPIDCVFTPTKKWAVQNSSVGLKEIV